MASNWSHPNIRNHVRDSSGMNMSRFEVKVGFRANSDISYYPFVLNDTFSTQSLIYHGVNDDKFIKHVDNLKEKSNEYKFAETSSQRPMYDAFKILNRQPYLYQLILAVNGIFNSLDYTSDVKNIRVPSQYQITSMLRDILMENNYRTMKVLSKPNDIRAATERLNNAEETHSLTDVIEEKLYIDSKTSNRRMSSPLFETYMKEKVQEIQETKDSDAMMDTMVGLLRKTTQYVKKT